MQAGSKDLARCHQAEFTQLQACNAIRLAKRFYARKWRISGRFREINLGEGHSPFAAMIGVIQAWRCARMSVRKRSATPANASSNSTGAEAEIVASSRLRSSSVEAGRPAERSSSGQDREVSRTSRTKWIGEVRRVTCPDSAGLLGREQVETEPVYLTAMDQICGHGIDGTCVARFPYWR